MKKEYELPKLSVTMFLEKEVIMLSGLTGTQDGLDDLDVDFS